MRVASVQMEPFIGEKRANVMRSIEFIETAADDGAELVVLPELANTGYVFRDRQEAMAHAEPVPGGETVLAWAEVAARRKLTLVAGIDERQGDALYNSAAVIGPEGYVGRYRKVHLWADEKKLFVPGDLGFPLFDLPFGRLGVAICYDGWFPETYRAMALQGVDIVCVPTNWVPMPAQPADRLAMANTLIMAGAHCNSIVIACADRIGIERGQAFEGQSLIVDRRGWPIAGPASRDREEILMAEVDLMAGRKVLGDFNDVLGDRRPDVYALCAPPGGAVRSRP